MISVKQSIALILLFSLVFSATGCAHYNSSPPSSPIPLHSSTPSAPQHLTTESTTSVNPGTAETFPTTSETSSPETDSTSPEVTDPTETESDTPTETEPQPTEHVHRYAVSEAVAPDCKNKGYSVYTCSCGESYEADMQDALGHHYAQQVTNPTCSDKGYTTYTCSACGDSYQADYTDALSHNYSQTVVEPTCIADGYTLFECLACKSSYKDGPVPAVGHNYTSSVTVPTCTEDGFTTHQCTACGYSYISDEIPAKGHVWGKWKLIKQATDSEGGEHAHSCEICGEVESLYIPPVVMTLEVSAPATEEETEVAQLVVAYVNLFREEEGSPQLLYLPGMSQVAQYRSRQLVTNCSHDITDKREALAYYKYGEYIDFAEYGCPELVDQNYYEPSTQEAIGLTSLNGTADEVAYELANACRCSEGHWRYVGNPEKIYIGVGVTYTADFWYVCIMVGTVDYG